MSLPRSCKPFLLFILISLARGSVLQSDFTGTGHILVLNSSDWATATPAQQVGCLDDHGSFVARIGTKGCGTFLRDDNYPYTLSSKEGNCTFNDVNTPQNTDSEYGRSDHAWTCNATYQADIYDELYTIDGFPYVFLCSGDIDCYYDAKAVPKDGTTVPFWVFRWGSLQQGITPGHMQLQLLWQKL